MATTLTPRQTTSPESRSSSGDLRAPVADSGGRSARLSPRRAPLPFRLSGALAVVAAVASAVGVFHSDIFRDPAWTAGNAQGTALVILAVAVPTVVISMVLTARGSLRAQIVWLGGLSY